MKEDDEKSYREMSEELGKENIHLLVRIRTLELRLRRKAEELETMTAGFNAQVMRNNQIAHMLSVWQNAYMELKMGMPVTIKPEELGDE